ncbi:hypothetical protein [Paenibacillus sp. MER 99-2]|uniref:hypothetical protein n=1 Tax=Paenibacillus sp. MER 99-2 TaxID=2939572 RepID=UPI00203D4B32|nr:hypothetical protein [Paenibacillus sp. MER 99-2]MCM3176239.1 hypothetical protein [Paenibacillus sp. MER 99-2]
MNEKKIKVVYFDTDSIFVEEEKKLLGQVGEEVVKHAKELGFKKCTIRGIIFSLDDAKSYVSQYHANDRFTIDIEGDAYIFHEGTNKYNPQDVVLRFR